MKIINAAESTVDIIFDLLPPTKIRSPSSIITILLLS